MPTTDIWFPCSDGTAFLPLQTLLSPVVCTVWIAAWWWAALERNDRISEKNVAQCGTEPTYLLKKAHVQNTHTDLSNVFHCRKRSKNMLSWYWAKGSPLRCLCRSLIHEAEKSFITPFKHMYTQNAGRAGADLLSTSTKDAVTGVVLQALHAALFMLQHSGHTQFGLRKQYGGRSFVAGCSSSNKACFWVDVQLIRGWNNTFVTV